jgi:hypothetical protein
MICETERKEKKKRRKRDQEVSTDQKRRRNKPANLILKKSLFGSFDPEAGQRGFAD